MKELSLSLARQVSIFQIIEILEICIKRGIIKCLHTNLLLQMKWPQYPMKWNIMLVIDWMLQFPTLHFIIDTQATQETQAYHKKTQGNISVLKIQTQQETTKLKLKKF